IAASFQHQGHTPRDAILAKPGRKLNEGPDVFRSHGQIDAGELVVADFDTLTVMGHRIKVKEMIADRRPQQAFLDRALSCLFRPPRHEPVSDQDWTPA